MRSLSLGLLIGLAAALVLLAGPTLMQSAQRNFFSLAATRLLVSGQPGIPPGALLAAQARPAYMSYQLGLLADSRGYAAQAVTFWQQALTDDARYMLLVRIHAARNIALAELAVRTYPERALSWDWRGDATVEAKPAEALLDYLEAAQRDPSDNLVWEKIGPLAEAQGNFDLALTAYRRACDLEPIRNGSCLSGGRLAYRAGDWTTVITYYERGGYPESVAGWVELIRAAQHLGLTADAERYLQLAQAEAPADYTHLLQNKP
jgi:tetratricopeptide (TPR) repeat protein